MHKGARGGIGGLLAALLAASGSAGLPAAAAAADEAEPGVVPLDRLLRLPSSVPAPNEIEKRGGLSKSQWQLRFETARAELEAARRALEAAREDLQENADSAAWKMAAPGLGATSDPTDSPADYKRTQELKRSREELTRAERQLQDLEVEANLAGVPDAWRHPVPPDPEGGEPPAAASD